MKTIRQWCISNGYNGVTKKCLDSAMLSPDKKISQIVKNMLKYDIELHKLDTSGIEDIGSISTTEFESLRQKATEVSLDDYFLIDELRRVI